MSGLMLACFDAGNTRLKWGLADASGWQAQGALGWDEIATLPELAARWPVLKQAWLANVAGPRAEQALALALPGVALQRVHSSARAAGVVNGYREPQQLGVDRWCALIGARVLETRACLVVTAGTATTVDSLDAGGHFLGGLILPGLALMRAALAQGTAQLPLAVAAHEEFPRHTEAAIISGCLEAQAGAVERAFRRLPGAACCLLSGGAAPDLLPLLADLPLRSVENLVLEGLRQLALEAMASGPPPDGA